MRNWLNRWHCIALIVAMTVSGMPAPLMAAPGERGYRSSPGMERVTRDRLQMQRDVRRATNRAEVRRDLRRAHPHASRHYDYRRHEARRHLRHKDHHHPHHWHRYRGRVIAGVALGTVIGVAIASSRPKPPHPDLCWFWSDQYERQGYWYYCREPM